MNKELVIIIGISSLALLFLALYIKTKIKLHRLDRALIEKNKEYTFVKNRLSMIEYYHRNYKEGKNPFTVLRDISNILYKEEIDEQKEEDRA